MLDYEIIRPIAWLAAIAFLVGFLGCLAFAPPPDPTRTASRPAAILSAAPAPGVWKVEKRI